MSRFHAIGSLTALAAAASLSGGPAHADPIFAFLSPPAQTQIAPPYAAPRYQAEPQLAAPDTGDENAELAPRLQRQVVKFPSKEAPGTIIIDTPHTFLYYVLGDGKAIRYGIGVGREGFTWSGVKEVVRKQEWPDWYPPKEMLERQPYLPRMMAGGPGNPLGARAMYIGGTQYRIHGTNDPSTIGKHVSSGCIRMTNDNAIDLYNRVRIGAKVIVLPQSAVPTREARAKAPEWQAKAEAAIAHARADGARNLSPVAERSARTSWNVIRPSGLY